MSRHEGRNHTCVAAIRRVEDVEAHVIDKEDDEGRNHTCVAAIRRGEDVEIHVPEGGQLQGSEGGRKRGQCQQHRPGRQLHQQRQLLRQLGGGQSRVKQRQQNTRRVAEQLSLNGRLKTASLFFQILLEQIKRVACQ